jgi:hypothetical protein
MSFERGDHICVVYSTVNNFAERSASFLPRDSPSVSDAGMSHPDARTEQCAARLAERPLTSTHRPPVAPPD